MGQGVVYRIAHLPCPLPAHSLGRGPVPSDRGGYRLSRRAWGEDGRGLVNGRLIGAIRGREDQGRAEPAVVGNALGWN